MLIDKISSNTLVLWFGVTLVAKIRNSFLVMVSIIIVNLYYANI